MKKILIVDYDQSSLASLQGVLAGRGYTVVTAADGQAGWDRYNKENPDLVLMEAMLPKVHGFELCQRITSERNSQATVFIMTGVYKDRVYRTEALRTYGASEYFEKPLKMAELLASVEAVLGKPEPVPDEEPAAAPVAMAPAARPATTGSAEQRRREKPKSDDSMFALPEDLDRLAREIPKARKPAPAVHEPAAEPRFDALADDLLKSVLVESKTPKPAAAKPVPENGNGNGNGKVDIDQFLASALAGLDLNKEKIKVPKTAPLPPAPTSRTAESTELPPVKETPAPMPPPAAAKPKPAPVPPAATESTGLPPVKETPAPMPPPVAAKPKPAPVPQVATTVPPPPASAPEPFVPKPSSDMKSMLTPGDPGSDVSPFFSPEKAKPAAPAEKPKVQPVAAPPAPVPVPKPVKPVEKTAKPPVPATAATTGPSSKTAPAASAVVDPARPVSPAPKSEPTVLDIAMKDMRPTVGGDIFQEFQEAEPEKKSGGFPKIIPIAVGIVAVAAVGYILLRPKRPAPAPAVTQKTVEDQNPTSTPSQPVVVPPADPSDAKGSPAASGTAGASATTRSAGPTELPAAKPAPAKQKVQPKPKPAEPDPAGADAILPILNNTSAALPPPGSPSAPGGGQTGAPAGQAQGETQQAKGEESAIPSGSETASGNPAGSGQVSEAGAPTADAPPAVPVKEGDLVELASVTEPPKLIKSADPIYPQTAQRLGVGGSITVNALIDEKGNVIDTGILKGIKDDKGLGRAAENAVRKWKFQPARKYGVAVKVWKSFVIAFKADANPANRME